MIDPQTSTWVDRDGFLKSHADWNDAGGDGAIILVTAGLLKVVPAEHVDRVLLSCVNPVTGLLMRRPDNSGGNSSHDTWVSVAIWCLFRKNAFMARGLLFSAFIRGGYVKNHPFDLKDKTLWKKLNIITDPWMPRYPKVFVVLLAAVLPWAPVRWFCSVLTRMLLSFASVPKGDASGTQLLWLDHMTLYLMTGNQSSLRSYLEAIRKVGSSIAEVMQTSYNGGLPFYDVGHVTITGFRHHEQEVLNAAG
jgi:hypothetical protein